MTTTEVGVPGAQQFITEHVPEWVERYGEKTAFFCTNDAHTEPLINESAEKLKEIKEVISGHYKGVFVKDEASAEKYLTKHRVRFIIRNG